ncbi:MAG: CsbD family protein [Nitrosomonas sp.]|nr:MAG: CsbD family protein [Nitrosomonas sp.]
MNWNHLKGKVKQHWGDWMDDELVIINGKRAQLIGKLQKRHIMLKQKPRKMTNDFYDRNE